MKEFMNVWNEVTTRVPCHFLNDKQRSAFYCDKFVKFWASVKTVDPIEKSQIWLGHLLVLHQTCLISAKQMLEFK